MNDDTMRVVLAHTRDLCTSSEAPWKEIREFFAANSLGAPVVCTLLHSEDSGMETTTIISANRRVYEIDVHWEGPGYRKVNSVRLYADVTCTWEDGHYLQEYIEAGFTLLDTE